MAILDLSSACPCSATASALLSAVLEKANLSLLATVKDNSQWARQQGGPKETWPADQGGGGGGGETAPSWNQLFNSTTAYLGAIYPPTIQRARCPVVSGCGQDMRGEMGSEGEQSPRVPTRRREKQCGNKRLVINKHHASRHGLMSLWHRVVRGTNRARFAIS